MCAPEGRRVHRGFTCPPHPAPMKPVRYAFASRTACLFDRAFTEMTKPATPVLELPPSKENRLSVFAFFGSCFAALKLSILSFLCACFFGGALFFKPRCM